MRARERSGGSADRLLVLLAIAEGTRGLHSERAAVARNARAQIGGTKPMKNQRHKRCGGSFNKIHRDPGDKRSLWICSRCGKKARSAYERDTLSESGSARRLLL
jgi:hypothetical protein